jgi:hypothetical protein
MDVSPAPAMILNEANLILRNCPFCGGLVSFSLVPRLGIRGYQEEKGGESCTVSGAQGAEVSYTYVLVHTSIGSTQA